MGYGPEIGLQWITTLINIKLLRTNYHLRFSHNNDCWKRSFLVPSLQHDSSCLINVKIHGGNSRTKLL